MTTDESREQEYKEKIKASLDSVLESGFVPELGEHKKGKVRDVHFSGDKVIMVASDRVSCFDHVLSRCIPFKGAVLNLFNEWATQNSAGNVFDARLLSPDVNVIVQRKMQNLGYECVVRGYVWGTLADNYEKGVRVKSGIELPEGLLRYQKLDEPIFTPTTKADEGHDKDVTLEDIAKSHGKNIADDARKMSLKLFQRGTELADKAGMIFIDTKYEFGISEEGILYLIDEANTPDSSRFCSKEEYERKWKQITEEMRKGNYASVSELLRARPELKIREESKQFVRDVLIEAGYEEGKPIPELTDEQVVETAFRYIDSYERLTGRKFDFNASELPTKKRIMNNLVKAGIAYGGCVVPMGASIEKDRGHWEKLEQALKDVRIPYVQPVFLSAHKKTQEVLDYVRRMDESIEPLVYIVFVGRSNGLGPVVAGNTTRPVIACPVFKDDVEYLIDVHSSLRMPSGVPLMTVTGPGNAVLAAKRIIDMLK